MDQKETNERMAVVRSLYDEAHALSLWVGMCELPDGRGCYWLLETMRYPSWADLGLFETEDGLRLAIAEYRALIAEDEPS